MYEESEELYLKSTNTYEALIVDDEEDLCLILQAICRRKGLIPIVANNLEEARSKLRKHPRIIFLDNNLPDGYGLDLIPAIRQQSGDSFIVMMTAQNSDNFQKKVFQSGINYFLVKPFDLSSVTNLIDKIS